MALCQNVNKTSIFISNWLSFSISSIGKHLDKQSILAIFTTKKIDPVIFTAWYFFDQIQKSKQNSDKTKSKVNFYEFFWVFLSIQFLSISVSAQSDVSGPVFVQEPPNQMDFSNTTGAEIICQSRGTPLPQITWVKTDGSVVQDVPGLRQVGWLTFLGTKKT